MLDDLQDFLDQHLEAVQFLMNRCDWDLFLFDLMATDRIQHELWHVWDLTHRAARGRERELGPCAAAHRVLASGSTEASARSRPTCRPIPRCLLMSDHGFGPIE